MFVRVSREEAAPDQRPQRLEVSLCCLLEPGLVAHLINQLVAGDDDDGPSEELQAVDGPIDIGKAPYRPAALGVSYPRAKEVDQFLYKDE